MKFSACFGITPSRADDWFDPDLSIDTKLFVDPFLLLDEASNPRRTRPEPMTTRKYQRPKKATGFGTWRFLFATESHIKQAAGSWNALVVATSPE